MRVYLALLAATMLTACGGGSGPQTVGESLITAPAVPTTPTAVAGGPGTGVTGGSGSGTTTPASGFLSLTDEKSFNAVGALQSLKLTGNTTLYQGNASTVLAPSGTVDYSPRDGIFTLTLADTKAGVNANLRFQDPAHRTNFDSSQPHSQSAPSLDGFNYLEVLGPSNSPATTPGGASVSDDYTFFYQRPGVSTNYVSLAGYVRDVIVTPATSSSTNIFERGAFVFGAPTLQGEVPTTGTGSYTGGFLATMIASSNYFQWITGSSTAAVDFTKSTVGLSFAGTVDRAFLNGAEVTNTAVKAGATFAATAAATIGQSRTGFTGQFASAAFTNPDGTRLPVDFAAISPGSSVAGASSVDGAFYGPGAVNLGGNFRIVGGVPNQRVDINGAFVGAKQP